MPKPEPRRVNEAYDPATDPNSRSGPISWISAHMETEPYKGKERCSYYYLVVSVMSPDHEGGQIEMIRSLLGIYSWDEDPPTLGHSVSTPGGIATGKWKPTGRCPMPAQAEKNHFGGGV